MSDIELKKSIQSYKSFEDFFKGSTASDLKDAVDDLAPDGKSHKESFSNKSGKINRTLEEEASVNPESISAKYGGGRYKDPFERDTNIIRKSMDYSEGFIKSDCSDPKHHHDKHKEYRSKAEEAREKSREAAEKGQHDKAKKHHEDETAYNNAANHHAQEYERLTGKYLSDIPMPVPMNKADMSPGGGGRFEAFVKKLEAKGYSEESAKKIAASAGRAKYGKKRFQNMAAKGKG